MENNTYNTLLDALTAAATILKDYQLLTDNAGTIWDIDNLQDACREIDNNASPDNTTYCIGWDGSIGEIRHNDEANVDWVYTLVETENDQ